MKRAAIAVSLWVVASQAGAQVVTQGPPQTVSTLEEVQNGEVRIGLSTIISQRTSVSSGAGSFNASAALTGVDLFARSDGIGVYARSFTASFPAASGDLAGTFAIREAGLLIGGPTLSIEGGVIQRTTSNLDDPTKQTIWRGGARSFWDIGSSGVQVTLNAGVRFAKVPDGTATSFKVVGVDGEVNVIVQAPRRLPFYALVGWHYERLDDVWSSPFRTEELSGPMLGIGFRLASRPFLR